MLRIAFFFHEEMLIKEDLACRKHRGSVFTASQLRDSRGFKPHFHLSWWLLLVRLDRRYEKRVLAGFIANILNIYM